MTAADDIQALREELAELRAENADLRSRLDQVEAKRPGPAVVTGDGHARRLDDGRQIFRHPAPQVVVALPDDGVLGRVLDVVGRRYPGIVGEDSRFFDAFKSASLWIAHIDRTEAIQPHYLHHYGDRAEDWLRANGRPRCDAGRAVLAAAIGCGDVIYQLHDPVRGSVAGIGLCAFGVTGRKPEPRWLDIAGGLGDLRAPTAPPRMPVQPTYRSLDIRPGREPGYAGNFNW